MNPSGEDNSQNSEHRAMARLVILSEAQMGRSYELKAGTTTIGRVEDNAFQIPEASVSSHHCEVELRATDLLIRDLNSTNGTFINGQQVTAEAIVKPGQTLRLGQIELRFELTATPGAAKEAPTTAAPATAPTSKPAPKTPVAPPSTPKKTLDQTTIIPQGVKLGQDHGQVAGFDPKAGFAKKSNTGTKIFITVAVIVGVIIVAVIAFSVLNTSSAGS